MELVIEILKKHGALAGIAIFLFMQNEILQTRVEKVELMLYNCYESRILNTVNKMDDTIPLNNQRLLAVLPNDPFRIQNEPTKNPKRHITGA